MVSSSDLITFSKEFTTYIDELSIKLEEKNKEYTIVEDAEHRIRVYCVIVNIENLIAKAKRGQELISILRNTNSHAT